MSFRGKRNLHKSLRRVIHNLVKFFTEISLRSLGIEMTKIKEIASFEADCPSPDRSGILSVFALKTERYSEEQESASKINYYRLYLQLFKTNII